MFPCIYNQRSKCQHKMETVFFSLMGCFLATGLRNKLQARTYQPIGITYVLLHELISNCKVQVSEYMHSFVNVSQTSWCFHSYLTWFLHHTQLSWKARLHDMHYSEFLHVAVICIFPIWYTEHTRERRSTLWRKIYHELDFSIIEHRKLFPLLWFTCIMDVNLQRELPELPTCEDSPFLSVVCTILFQQVVAGRKVGPFLCRMFAYL